MTNFTDPRPILLTGGTGKTGRRVAERLEALGQPVRIGSRRADPPFDWDEPDTWAGALDGARAVYVTYYPDIAFPGGADAVDAFVQQAVAGGRAAWCCCRVAARRRPSTRRSSCKASGANWTIVRCAVFAQNFDEGVLVESVQAGTLAMPAGDVAEPFLDVDDIADVVTAALTDDRHIGHLYELTGPRLLTFHEAMAEVSAAAGRPVQYVPVSSEEFVAELRGAGMPEDEATGLTELFAAIFDGRNQSLADGVQEALGRPPRDFAEYARRAAATGAWDPAPVS